MTSTRPLNARRDDIDSKPNPASPRTAHLHIQQPAAPNTCGRNQRHLAASPTAPSQHAPASPARTHRDYMTPFGFVSAPAPDFTIHTPSFYSPFVGDSSSDAFLSASYLPDFFDGFGPGMGEPVAVQRATKRARAHQRTPSASTIASNGPASPYSATTLYPQIASSERSPSSPLHLADQTFFAKPYPSENFFGAVSYMPGQAAHAANTQHFGMKGLAFDQSRDDLSNVFQPARLSMSSQSNGSPASGLFGGGAYGSAVDAKGGSSLQNEYTTPNPNVQLFRTDSQAYQDNLYNPTPSYAPAPVTATKRKSEYLSPPHHNLITERLQTANMLRSVSPNSALPRDKSPFRDGLPLAATNDWRNAGVQIATAADLRRQQKEEAEQAEYAQLMPQLQREQTKTISPKDAVLDCIDPDQPSLFQETIPAGYKQHTSPADAWPTEFVPQPGSTFGNLSAVTSGQAMPPFRATSGDEFVASYDYMPSPSDHVNHAQLHAASLQRNMYVGPKMKFADSDPEFPPSLVRMESSISDSAQGFSSQDSAGNMSMPQRPSDTRANTGAFPCTYHGCAQRFGSPANLQKHKKDYHRVQMQQQLHDAQQQAQQQLRQQQSTDSASGETPSSSSGSPGSPTSVGTSMTPAAIAARNSQAGPHKCSRINPSTNKPCNTVFSRPYDLTRHEDTIHNGRKQKVRCPMCREEKTFSRSDALTRHMRVVHPEVETLGKRGRRGD